MTEHATPRRRGRKPGRPVKPHTKSPLSQKLLALAEGEALYLQAPAQECVAIQRQAHHLPHTSTLHRGRRYATGVYRAIGTELADVRFLVYIERLGTPVCSTDKPKGGA
jgi:hypothetical protein